LRAQKANPNIGNNKYLAGISAHNLGVVEVILGRPQEAIAHFREAICLKENAFGLEDTEVGLSWDELGIQLFASSDFEGALASFREARNLRRFKHASSSHPSVAMVLNNMACCYFQMGDLREALKSLQEADEIQQKAVGSSAQAELDLLHVAIVICNCGYLKLALKEYDEARSLLEEALLIQQSVLEDNHRAVRDTISNIDFANAFHC
jgi:tetratricopeptide (TPR) repeat protein